MIIRDGRTPKGRYEFQPPRESILDSFPTWAVAPAGLDWNGRSRVLEDRDCVRCGQTFATGSKSRRYCTARCRDA